MANIRASDPAYPIYPASARLALRALHGSK